MPPRDITLHILHDNTLSLDNYEKFVYLAGQYNQIIKFHNVEKICAEEINRIKNLFANYPSYKRFSIGAFYRILIPQILDLEKSIYIDADTIVNLDIKELWNVELGDKSLGAVASINHKPKVEALLCQDGIVEFEDYFGSGVLLMNLKQIRQNERENIENGIKFLSENFQYGCFDQEILNYCFSKKYLKLNGRFDFYVRDSRKRGEFETDNRILHYLAQVLNLDFNDKFNKLYFYYFAKTPWFNEDTIGNIYNGVRELYVERQNLMTLVSAAVSGKYRVFVTESENINALKQIFYVNEGEEIFQINSSNWLNELAINMKNSVGKKIYFIFIGEFYQRLHAILTQVGFVEWRDFINGEIFLSELHGVKWNSYRLIKTM
ncbi:MAG: hypothetical protein IJQ16_04735 [Selenomonadaceae bacterium]|nr:hypothetical protein [Selenomonadaceae bacterium]